MREAFEAEYSKGDFGLAGCDLSKHEDGSYVNDATFSAFFWFSKGLAAQAQQEETKQRTCPENVSRISPVVALATPAP